MKMSETVRRLATKRRRGARPGDEGIAIIMVIGVGFVVSLLLSTLIAYTVLSIGNARQEQDYQSAVSAARAGVDDYVAHLNANNVYWQSTDCTNIAMQRPMGGTCGWGTSTAIGWVPIAGAKTPSGTSCTVTPTPPSCAVYHYDVDASSTLSNGTISVSSTGKSKGVTRTVKVLVRRQSFGDFLYFTNFETIDPSNPFVYGFNNTTAATQCSRHFWDSPPRNTSYCLDINFISGDTINGPLHSNDALLMLGTPTFNGPVTTAYPSCQPVGGVAPPASSCYRNAGGANPTFAKGISYVPQLPMPASNGALQAQTISTTSYGTPGCGYTGPTRIHFNNDGTMDVWSPYTKTVNTGCGTAPFTASSQRITVPANNVIYVAGVPSGQASPAAGNCAAGAIGGFPQANDVNFSYGEYDCRAGTVFVDGVLKGRVTIGSQSNIVITDNITYAGGSSGGDSLGLIAQNAVEVYHPVQCSAFDSSGNCSSGTNMNRPTGTPFNNPIINAAILSLQHSFGVQLFSLGSPLGTLNVYGSIAQLYRGVVGTTSNGSVASGYIKSYVYDTRLKFAPPPFYLTPVQAKYIAAVFAETASTY